MNRIPRTSLEQWAVLRAVIEAGGFAQAAEALHRSQSSVSYALARLRERTGIDLVRIDGRKAQLTPEGRTLLDQAIPLIDDLLRLERRIRAAAGGTDIEITLLVDNLFPRPSLFGALSDLEGTYPDTEVHLHTGVRLLAEAVAGLPYDLTLALWTPDAPRHEWAVDITLIPVAGAGHPLAVAAHALDTRALAQHRIATIAASGPRDAPRPASAPAARTWQTNSVESAIDMVRSRSCWGWLPAHMIADDLSAGRLARLKLQDCETRTMRLCLTLSDRAAPSPAARYLSDLLRAHAHDQLRLSA